MNICSKCNINIETYEEIKTHSCKKQQIEYLELKKVDEIKIANKINEVIKELNKLQNNTSKEQIEICVACGQKIRQDKPTAVGGE